MSRTKSVVGANHRESVNLQEIAEFKEKTPIDTI
jgi:hypothetical protein